MTRLMVVTFGLYAALAGCSGEARKLEIASENSAGNCIVATDALVTLQEIAGEYYFGDGLGLNCSLTLTKQGDFVIKSSGCVSHLEYGGRANLKGGVLSLTPNESNVPEQGRDVETEFFPVSWGTRMYLIPTKRNIEFCNDVNAGFEPRHMPYGCYFLRDDDWKSTVAGLPTVHEPWNKYLLSKPVSGKITELIERQEAWVDLGTDHGILQGMMLHAQVRHPWMSPDVTVEAVEKNRCRIKHEKYHVLEVGQGFSSR